MIRLLRRHSERMLHSNNCTKIDLYSIFKPKKKCDALKNEL